jgi:hypothetical protein
MSLNADAVVVGITGRVYVGATSATAPTSSTSTLSGFTSLGYVSADGVEFATDKSSNEIRAWQNSDLIRSTITESTITYSFMLMETNEDVLELYFGTTPVDGKIEFAPNKTGGRKSFVIDVVDNDKSIRHYIPSGEVMSIEAQTIQNGEAVGYGVTVTAYASDDRTVDIFYSEFEGS